MLFKSEEVRDEFHRTNSILQMLCSVFEGICYRYDKQVEVIQVLNKAQVLVQVEGLENIQMEAIEDLMNRHHGRKDEFKTCLIKSLPGKTFTIYGRLSTDLNLN